MQRQFLAAAAILAATASPALAHTGATPVSGLASGFLHPVGGLDHVLAMVAVGFLAVRQGGSALWILPAAFVGMMVAGGLLSMSGIPVPFVELGITGSVIILGIVVALGRRMPMAAAAAMVGVLAVFHGHAHGTEMPVNAGGLGYAAGFAGATLLLHAAGIGIGFAMSRLTEKVAPIAIRFAGGLVAAAGVYLLAA